jgi:hypothetical protein
MQIQYWSYVGSYEGAVKFGELPWERAKNLNYINKKGWIRIQGPPSAAIGKALKSKTCGADFKNEPFRKLVETFSKMDLTARKAGLR